MRAHVQVHALIARCTEAILLIEVAFGDLKEVVLV